MLSIHPTYAQNKRFLFQCAYQSNIEKKITNQASCCLLVGMVIAFRAEVNNPRASRASTVNEMLNLNSTFLLPIFFNSKSIIWGSIFLCPQKAPLPQTCSCRKFTITQKKNGKITVHEPVKLHTYYLANEQKTGQCIKSRVPPSLNNWFYPPDNIVFRLPAHKWVRFHQEI